MLLLSFWRLWHRTLFLNLDKGLLSSNRRFAPQVTEFLQTPVCKIGLYIEFQMFGVWYLFGEINLDGRPRGNWRIKATGFICFHSSISSRRAEWSSCQLSFSRYLHIWLYRRLEWFALVTQSRRYYEVYRLRPPLPCIKCSPHTDQTSRGLLVDLCAVCGSTHNSVKHPSAAC